jgi:hypothetical protein
MSYDHPDDTDTILICLRCVGDSFLREEIRAEGKLGDCSYCRATENVISLSNLADRIHSVLDEQFYVTPSEPEHIVDVELAKEGRWERSGDPVGEIIAEIAGLDEPIVEDIRAYVSDIHADFDTEEDNYTEDTQYAEHKPDDQNFRDTWQNFCQQLQWRTRFFSQYAEIDLSNIFGDLSSLRTIKGIPVIRDISPSDKDRFVFRARLALSHVDLQNILKYPSRELGAPPSRLARAGRMNAAGISVFYGAVDVETCVAEIRAPVGSSVIVGGFEIIRPVRLLDMDALTQVYVRGSHFDPEFRMRRGRASFFGDLVQTISRPVMQNEETFEYLPTQVIAEYLATKVTPPFDGVVFRSSQTGGEGRNVVLFHHASAAVPDDVPPGTKFTFWIGSGPDDDFDPTIAIYEKVPAPETLKPVELFGVPMSPPSVIAPDCGPGAGWLPHREPVLRLNKDSVYVLHVKAIRYECEKRAVLRYRRFS